MSAAPLLLDHAQIAGRIPHAGRMCLLDAVLAWDAQRIVCRTARHRRSDHALRIGERLGVGAGIEYAAQAMAVHGSLLAEREGVRHAPAPGFLASARGVRMRVRWLDAVEDDLLIEAERLASDAAGLLYRFELRAGTRSLLDGRASVMLTAATTPDGESGRRP